MLYPKEDKMTSRLMYACRTCQSSKEATSSCVFRNYLSTNVGETAGVTQDVGNDPTVGPTLFLCLLCGTNIVAEEEAEDNDVVEIMSGIETGVRDERERVDYLEEFHMLAGYEDELGEVES